MRAMKAPQKPRPIRDPAPSKWRYRWQRMMLTPGVRTGLRVGLPVVILAGAAGAWVLQDENRALVDAKIAEVKAAIQQRPEFMVTALRVDGGDGRITADVERVLQLDLPASSFDLNLEEMRRTVAALNAVAEAAVRVGESGTLVVQVTPRVPVAIWREGQTLKLLDKNGKFVSGLAARTDRLDLPLIAGDGAKNHIDEALALFRSAGPISDRVRGLVRMGERRWDMVLDKGQRILLPEDAPIAAMDRVIAINQAQELLDRDVVAVDMRNPARATVRMHEAAASAMRRVRQEGDDN